MPPVPRLRPLEPVMFDHEGERRVAWRDPLGLADQVDVPHPVAMLMSLLDGERDVDEICAAWQELSGEALPPEFVERFAGELDEHLLLDTPRFAEARAGALAAFRGQPVRAMAHAVGGYPDEPEACAAHLEDLLDRGRKLAMTLREGQIQGLVAPHIDLHRGGECYGAAYDALRESEADLFIVLATAHSSTCWPEEPPLATLTRLDYETPFGRATTDQAFIDTLCERYAEAGGDPDDLFRDELVHRAEHSAEFQVLFLDHLFGDRPYKVVPILLGSLHEFYLQPDLVESERGLGPFIDALAAAIDSYPGQVCLIAGADLSHVGPRFGDEEEVDDDRVDEVATADEQALGAFVGQGAEAFFEHFAACENDRNVCSVANLYALRALLPDAEVELLRYQVAFDPEQTVSFAAGVLR